MSADVRENIAAGMPASAQANTGRIRYQSLEAWRGLACLAVVVFHSIGPLDGQPLWSPLEPLRTFAMKGWLGLHLFFVISGFCIFERLRVAQIAAEKPTEFLRDRLRRVFPTYWVVLALNLAIALLAMPFNGSSLASNLPASPTAWVTNLSLTFLFFDQNAFLVIAWTLACEVTFYAVAALLLAASREDAALQRAFIIGGALCIATYWAPVHGWGLVLRLWPEFFAGACVAGWVHARRCRTPVARHAAAWTLLLLSAGTVLDVGRHDNEPLHWTIAFAWLLLLGYRWDAQVSSYSLVRAFAWIGACSYSLYLIHVPILSRLMNLAYRFVEPTLPFFSVIWLVAVSCAVACGWLVWRGIEQPFERSRLRRRACHQLTRLSIRSESQAS
jgi:peptidoglycan/LPS O-acetylase OafA/YrhL